MKKNTVFIVDDNQSICDSLQWLLSIINIPTKTFLSAEDFLNICHTDMLGCLLLDMQLPQMDGPTLLYELNRRNIHLPVIIISGQTDIPTTVHTIYQPLVAIFKKPVDTDELVAAIQSLIDE